VSIFPSTLGTTDENLTPKILSRNVPADFSRSDESADEILTSPKTSHVFKTKRRLCLSSISNYVPQIGSMNRVGNLSIAILSP